MDVIDTPSLLHWLVHRQMQYDGGFQGRTNKLVDSCYSFWQGATFTLLTKKQKPITGLDGEYLFDTARIKEYLLLCCQDATGGLRDKPPKSRDLYHTCYALCGLSIIQHCPDGTINSAFGESDYILESMNAEHGIAQRKCEAALKHFSALPIP
eukprot:TRINITY_DN33_c0_g2_i4.p1 TRINITY_DN33_c0_g2~~TRINITY_DN33_c0_g2_i4.p1  ORF type:complete len:153 (+),score=15.46 TRINITY_DN33_c0_g2_i4:150-608(+)